jgi:hypothetical protein
MNDLSHYVYGWFCSELHIGGASISSASQNVTHMHGKEGIGAMGDAFQVYVTCRRHHAQVQHHTVHTHDCMSACKSGGRRVDGQPVLEAERGDAILATTKEWSGG